MAWGPPWGQTISGTIEAGEEFEAGTLSDGGK